MIYIAPISRIESEALSYIHCDQFFSFSRTDEHTDTHTDATITIPASHLLVHR